jgi:hypothetical protein
MIDHLLRLTEQEAIEQGYLIVQRCGTNTSYIPTAKYRDAMRAPKALPMTTYTSQGEFIHDPEDIHHLCGECGTPLFDETARCGCPIAPPAPGRYQLLLPHHIEEVVS